MIVNMTVEIPAGAGAATVEPAAELRERICPAEWCVACPRTGCICPVCDCTKCTARAAKARHASTRTSLRRPDEVPARERLFEPEPLFLIPRNPTTN